MNLAQEIAKVEGMNTGELLHYVIAHPHYLTDLYFKGIGDAIRARHTEIIAAQSQWAF